MDLNYYPCFGCDEYNKPLTYFPGSENLLCDDCAKKYYPTQKEIDEDIRTFKNRNEAGIL
jgi:hypothetical protein